ncbi:hypothetical protein C4573_04590 [Candidatus Woesearchaeota archaeon]|nr:MAG: hypothetical protein C4573_04590 [Candidatus Woesearchaeota archaeon]
MIILLTALQACENNLDEKTVQRVDVLYEHTVLMKQLGTPKQLERIGLNADYILDSSGLAPEDKINALENAYNMPSSGNYKERIIKLEEKMSIMMQNWGVE